MDVMAILKLYERVYSDLLAVHAPSIMITALDHDPRHSSYHPTRSLDHDHCSGS